MPESNTWEFTFKMNFGQSQLSSWRLFVTDDKANYIGFLYGGNSATVPFVWISSGTKSWNLASQGKGSISLQANTDYWVKAGWDKDKYYVKYSTNGIDYTIDYSLSSKTAISSSAGLFTIGKDQTYSVSATTSIDLKHCFININDKLWWKAITVIML